MKTTKTSPCFDPKLSAKLDVLNIIMKNMAKWFSSDLLLPSHSALYWFQNAEKCYVIKSILAFTKIVVKQKYLRDDCAPIIFAPKLCLIFTLLHILVYLWSSVFVAHYAT